MSKRLRSSEMCADCSGPGESPGRARSLSAAARDPCPAPPPRVRRLPAAEPCTPCAGVATRSPWGRRGARAVPGLSEPGGQGAAALPSLRPCRAARGGLEAGPLCHRKGLGPRTGSQLQKSGRAPAAPAAQVSLGPPPPPPRAAAPPGARPGWAPFAASLRRDQPAAPRTTPRPDRGARFPPGSPGGRGWPAPPALGVDAASGSGIGAARVHTSVCLWVTLGCGCVGRPAPSLFPPGMASSPAPAVGGPRERPAVAASGRWCLRPPHGSGVRSLGSPGRWNCVSPLLVGYGVTHTESLAFRHRGPCRAEPSLPCVVCRFRVQIHLRDWAWADRSRCCSRCWGLSALNGK